jgi:hypothetical protein
MSVCRVADIPAPSTWQNVRMFPLTGNQPFEQLEEFERLACTRLLCELTPEPGFANPRRAGLRQATTRLTSALYGPNSSVPVSSAEEGRQ